jgi:hypothetical protein
VSPPVPLYHIYTTYTTFKTKKFDKKRPPVGGFARILGLFNCQSTVKSFSAIAVFPFSFGLPFRSKTFMGEYLLEYCH